jgi:hypothetical protein
MPLLHVRRLPGLLASVVRSTMVSNDNSLLRIVMLTVVVNSFSIEYSYWVL